MIGGCFVIEFLDLNCTNKKINFVLFVDLMLLPDCLGIFFSSLLWSVMKLPSFILEPVRFIGGCVEKRRRVDS